MGTAGRKAVLGIGNPLRRDDGIGIRVIEELRRGGRLAGTDLIDGGTAPDLLSLLEEGTALLIIVDALQAGGAPGHIHRLELRPENIAEEAASTPHGLGVLDSLRLMGRLGMQSPQVIVIGVEPMDTSPGLGLTPTIESTLAGVVKLVEDELGCAD